MKKAMDFQIRPYHETDAAQVNQVAQLAFAQYQPHFEAWPTFIANVGRMSEKSATAELIVATTAEAVVGAVVYVGPGREKLDIFPVEWAILRLLVVAPQARGNGIGKALTHACIANAQRDHADTIALHTSPIMTVALPMYLRMGFEKTKDAPNIGRVSYAVYAKSLAAC